MQSSTNLCFLRAEPEVEGDDESRSRSSSRRRTISGSGLPLSFHGITSLLRGLAKKKSLHDGRHLHSHIICIGYDLYTSISNGIIQFYAMGGEVEEATSAFQSSPSPNVYSWNFLLLAYGHKGHLDKAWELFCDMPTRNIVSWNLMIGSCSDNGCAKEALCVFHHMFIEGPQPDTITFVSALNACVRLTSVTHETNDEYKDADPQACQYNVDLRKGGSPSVQRSYFTNSNYAGHVKANHTLWNQHMVLEEAHMMHTAIVGMGYEQDGFIGNALTNVYGKCQSVASGLSVFHRATNRDVVTWTAMIASFSQNDYTEEALTLFKRMLSEGVIPNNVTFACALDACGSLASIKDGEYIHASIVEYGGLHTDPLVGNALVSLYGKCKRVHRAESVFLKMHSRDAVSWNTMISTFSQNGCASEALGLFEHMLMEGLKPDKITLICAVDACAGLRDMVEGLKLHDLVVMAGYEHLEVVGSALISLYGNTNAVHEAMDTFQRIHHKDLVSWNALIYAYAINDYGKETLDLFWQMRLRGLQADTITFCGVLEACANLACMEEGKEIHSIIDKEGYGKDFMVGTALLDMYAKCGSVSEANNVFKKLSKPNVVTWTALIAAFSQNGRGREALVLLGEMQIAGTKPGSITFTSILAACGHVGLVDEAVYYFSSMKLDYGLEHTLDHYFPMIDLLGRAGRLDEAEAMIHEVPIEDNGISWECLLSACRVHSDLIRGSWAATHCFESGPKKVAPMITLDNIYRRSLH